jgi:hypothetical protein
LSLASDFGPRPSLITRAWRRQVVSSTFSGMNAAASDRETRNPTPAQVVDLDIRRVEVLWASLCSWGSGGIHRIWKRADLGFQGGNVSLNNIPR